jgi:hypothetical protein
VANAAIRATAEGQVGDDGTGEATDRALDPGDPKG